MSQAKYLMLIYSQIDLVLSPAQFAPKQQVNSVCDALVFPQKQNQINVIQQTVDDIKL